MHKRKLNVRLETLRELRDDHLAHVAGGDDTLPITYGYCASSPLVCHTELFCRTSYVV